MRIRLIPRKSPSTLMVYATPFIAVLFTIICGGFIFSLIGYDGFSAVREIFIAPIIDPYAWRESIRTAQ